MRGWRLRLPLTEEKNDFRKVQQMLKKGNKKDENPEKMPCHTSGIEMTFGGNKAKAAERLTGGNAAADESLVSKMVTDHISGK